MAFKFYYDETEHRRKINLKTIKADNFYDNFMTVIIGWDDEFSDEIEKKYLVFEEKYNDRKSKGELKSTTLSQRQFVNPCQWIMLSLFLIFWLFLMSMCTGAFRYRARLNSLSISYLRTIETICF